MTGDFTTSLGAVLLCGGASRRMGRPKAELPWGEKTLLEHLVGVLDEAGCRVCVVASPQQKLPQLARSITIAFDPIAFQGPLQGMQVGLQALEKDCEAAFVLSCDSPFMTPEFVREVCAHLGTHEIAVPKDEHFHHPLAAAYRTNLADRIAHLLAADQKRPRFLLDQSDTLELDPTSLKAWDSEGLTLSNVNTPEEYRKALQRRSLLDR